MAVGFRQSILGILLILLFVSPVLAELASQDLEAIRQIVKEEVKKEIEVV